MKKLLITAIIALATFVSVSATNTYIVTGMRSSEHTEWIDYSGLIGITGDVMSLNLNGSKSSVWLDPTTYEGHTTDGGSVSFWYGTAVINKDTEEQKSMEVAVSILDHNEGGRSVFIHYSVEVFIQLYVSPL